MSHRNEFQCPASPFHSAHLTEWAYTLPHEERDAIEYLLSLPGALRALMDVVIDYRDHRGIDDCGPGPRAMAILCRDAELVIARLLKEGGDGGVL